MKKSAIYLFLVCFYSFQTFALTEDEKAKIVEKVYTKICKSLGSAEEKPKLVFNSTRAMQIAYMTKDRDGAPVIGFESKAFDVCAKLGDRMEDAIAFLLGHELSHHYLNHHWGEDFKSVYSLGALEKEIRNIDRAGIKKFETQADERGGILCYLAGFSTAGIADKLLSDLYTAYEISTEESPKYPSLADRIRIAKEQDSLVQTYIKVYETGNAAMLIGEYELAISCYESIINHKFHSASIYNNLGVAYFLSGVKADDLNPLKYYYPIELDVLLAAKRVSSKGMGKSPETFYQDALIKFDQALGFDPSNLSAQLNKVCTYSAMKNMRKAGFYLEEIAEQEALKNHPNTYNNYRLLEAIVLHQEGDTENALNKLRALEKEGFVLAKVNLSMIENDDELSDVNTSVSPITWSAAKNALGSKEQIAGVNEYSTMELDRIFKEVQNIVVAKGSEIYVGEKVDQRICLFVTPEKEVKAFHTVNEKYKGQTGKGLKIGSSIKELEKTYGPPSSILASNAGTYYMYNSSDLFFLVNERNQIVSWTLVKDVN